MLFSLLDLICLLSSLAFGFLGTYLICLDLFPTFSLIPILSSLITPLISPSPAPASATSGSASTGTQTTNEGEKKPEEVHVEQVEPFRSRLDKLDNGTILQSQAKALITLMKNPHFGLPVRQRLVQLKKRKVVDGFEIVDWMMSWLRFEKREDAIVLGEHLLHRALIFHVSNSETFLDSRDALYSFKEYKKETPLATDQLTKYFPEERISDLVDVVKKTTETRQTKRFTKVHDHCFHGADGVDVLMKLIPELESRPEAVDLGQYLLERGAFHHLNRTIQFRDSMNDFYQFYQSPEASTRKKVLEQTNNQIPVVEGQVWRDDRDWKLLLAGAKKVKFTAKETIFDVGTTLTAFYRVSTGSVRVTTQNPPSSLVLGPRQVFGEVAAIGVSQKTCVSAVAEEDTEVWILETVAVNKIFASDPTLAERFFKNMALSFAQIALGKYQSGLTSSNESDSFSGSSGNLTSSTSADSLKSLLGGNDDPFSSKKFTREAIEELGVGGLGGVIGGTFGTGLSPAALKLMTNPSEPTLTRGASRESVIGSDFLRSTFNLPPSEAILYDFPCKFKAKVLLLGTLYVSQNHICFYSSLFGVKTKKVIPIKSVTTVDSNSISHEIKIEIKDPAQGFKKYVFDFSKDTYDEAHKTLSAFLSVRPTESQGMSASASMSSLSGDIADLETSSDTHTSFETLRPGDWEKIISQASILTFKKDEIIVAQDQLSITVYQIVHGSCRVERKLEEGETKLLSVIQSGDTLGELNFVRGCGSAVSIYANEDQTEVYAIDGPKLHALFDRDQDLAVRFYKYVCTLILARLGQNRELVPEVKAS